MVRIVPYKSFGSVQLGSNEGMVVEQLGPPNRRVINNAGEIELRYISIVVRLHSSRGVVEITSRPDEVQFGEKRISRHDLPQHIQRIDRHASEIHGFMVSFEHGVAVDTDTLNDGWISVFEKGRWDEFRGGA